MNRLNEQPQSPEESTAEPTPGAEHYRETLDRIDVPNDVMMVSEIMADYLDQSGYRFYVSSDSASRTIRFDGAYVTTDELSIILAEYENPRTAQDFNEAAQTLTIRSKRPN